MNEKTDPAERLLHKLIVHFLNGSLNFALNEDEVNLMSWKLQEQLINKTINSEINKKFPIRNKFIKLFLKKLLTYIETAQDIHDELYTCLCDAINAENNTDDSYYRHYLIDSDIRSIITMRETNNMVVNGTTGMRTWEAALMLADWALSNKPLLNGKTIIELGSGIGFTGITIAKFCNPKSIMLTDCHKEVLRTICDNIEINISNYEKEIVNDNVLYRSNQARLGVMNLDWNDLTELSNIENPDVIIGADIVYDPSILQPLCNVLRKLSVNNRQLEIYICSVVRNEGTIKKFIECLDKNGFRFEYLQTTNNHIEWDQNIEACFLKIVPIDIDV